MERNGEEGGNPAPRSQSQLQSQQQRINSSDYSCVSHRSNSVAAVLTEPEMAALGPQISRYHTYTVTRPGAQCTSLVCQRIKAPTAVVWSVVRRFDKPQIYKHFIKSCKVGEGFDFSVGSTRDVQVISGLPGSTSTERLDVLDEENMVSGFTIIGGEHRLRNYSATTTVHGFGGESVVLESYVVDVPAGNTDEDTRLFADTVVKLNLQKLASVSEAMVRG